MLFRRRYSWAWNISIARYRSSKGPPIAIVMLIGYSGLYLFLFWLLRVLGMDKLRAALLGYTFASTAVPIYGLTVLVPIYGEQVGTGIVGLTALITNLTQVAIAVFLLQSAAANSVAAKSAMGASTLATIGCSAANPLVWSPIVGATIRITSQGLLGWSGGFEMLARRYRPWIAIRIWLRAYECTP
jgi:hypothetical protein